MEDKHPAVDNAIEIDFDLGNSGFDDSTRLPPLALSSDHGVPAAPPAADPSRRVSSTSNNAEQNSSGTSLIDRRRIPLPPPNNRSMNSNQIITKSI